MQTADSIPKSSRPPASGAAPGTGASAAPSAATRARTFCVAALSTLLLLLPSPRAEADFGIISGTVFLALVACGQIEKKTGKKCLDAFFDSAEPAPSAPSNLSGTTTAPPASSGIVEKPWTPSSSELSNLVRQARDLNIRQIPGGKAPWLETRCPSGREVTRVEATQTSWGGGHFQSQGGVLTIECRGSQGQPEGPYSRVFFKQDRYGVQVQDYLTAHITANGELREYERYRVGLKQLDGTYTASRSKRVFSSAEGNLVIEHLTRPSCGLSRFITDALGQKNACDPNKELLSFRDEERWCPVSLTRAIAQDTEAYRQKATSGAGQLRTKPETLNQCKRQVFSGAVRAFERTEGNPPVQQKFIVLESEVYEGRNIRDFAKVFLPISPPLEPVHAPAGARPERAR